MTSPDTPEWLYPRPDLPPVLSPAQADVTVNLWLLPKFSMLTLYCLLEPLRVANRFGRALFAWRLYSSDGEPVVASNGVRVDVEAALNQAPIYDNLFVVASYEPEAAAGAAQWAVLRQVAAHGGLLAGLETGAFILARAGLMEGYEVALHWESRPAFIEEFPMLALSEARYRFDRQRLTGGGGASSLDLMMAFIEREQGANLVAAISRQLVHSRPAAMPDAGRNGSVDERGRFVLTAEPAPGDFRPRSVRRAEAIMEANLAQPLPIPEICRRVGQSQRQLNRLFQRYAGETAKGRYLSLRLDRAYQILADSRASVTQAGLAAGFLQPAHFSRAYRARFGESPSTTAGRGR
ncbi:GlxA family transcriptional regulator [Salinicola rhizosphaerae]|uniref:HTH-type transcriptional regulator CdhR n=1 Tax=Salinicola rhizosphaerae TaxID=1443141 RepID=A0ABQ3DV47_9GAMM|nr:helix-turn-helix domain-containing protein [Salinicola rhizosphaerae]GHB16288.1 HTH-type transcriptional regulator CdhR [Salinicola rhizosphaerae]